MLYKGLEIVETAVPNTVEEFKAIIADLEKRAVSLCVIQDTAFTLMEYKISANLRDEILELGEASPEPFRAAMWSMGFIWY